MERSFEPPAQFEQVRTRARGANTPPVTYTNMLTPLEHPLTVGDVRVMFMYDALAGGLNYLGF